MYAMARPLVTIAACIAVLCASFAPIVAHESLEGEDESKGEQKSALFDFANYQQLFAKQYGSQLEAATRRVYFLANAVKVYVSGVAYKFWRQRYYLAVNEFSDWSPRELDMMTNRISEAAKHSITRLAEGLDRSGGEKDNGADVATSDGANVQKHRRKRETSSNQVNKPVERASRSITMNDLIKSGKRDNPAGGRPGAIRAGRRAARPQSNNPDYDPLLLEPATMGLMDQQESVDVWSLPASYAKKKPRDLINAASASAAKQVAKLFSRTGKQSSSSSSRWKQWSSSSSSSSSSSKGVSMADEMFTDLRNDGCFLEPRNQGKCGSCYAFAAVAMMEHLYCNNTGELLAFSEQYLIDCGRGHVEGMNGCTSGGGWCVPNFIHNFGMELARHYPYQARENQCPYSDDTDLKKTGFIRMELKSIARVHSSDWPKHLKYGPLFVTLAVGGHFHQYGGGVDDGENCSDRPKHAMVVVGHGREDGQEFWLMRNSHGTRWGEQGYYKLAREAPERCIEFQEGFAFGTTDGKEFIRPRRNWRNKGVALSGRDLVPRDGGRLAVRL